MSKVITMSDQLPHLLRSDAQDNRDRVLDAARALFSERGLDVPVRDIARRAEVGPATLYRRFPTKQSLINEAFADEFESCQQIVEGGCTDPDPWSGFRSVIQRLGELTARNHGFVDAFMSASPEAFTVGAHRMELLQKLSELAERAKRSGELRPDFVIDDLVLILLASRGLQSKLTGSRDVAAARFSSLAIDAFRHQGSEITPPPAAPIRGGVAAVSS